MSFLQEYAERWKAENKVRVVNKKRDVEFLVDSFYYLVHDVARAKYNVSYPDEIQFARTAADFMIWLDDSYRKSRKIKRSKGF